MKEPLRKRLLLLGLTVCLGLGSTLQAAAAEQKTPETITEEGAAEEGAAKKENSAGETTDQKDASQGAQEEQSPAAAAPAVEEDGDGGEPGDGSGSSNKPNTDITVTPSDANALILMDAGAQSPRAVPGTTVTVVLPLAVNREYLPSEKYVLRNITIQPDIPKEATKDNWPFDVVNASYVRHLNDMSYNSTATVYYDLRVSEFAKKGVYPVNFKVNATVWREDSVNGTSISEDVTFTLNVFMTVAENGGESGVTSANAPLDVAGRENTAIASPTGSPGQTVVMSLPIVNKGGTLTNVTVAPVVSATLDEFPFVSQDINYGRELGTMENGERRTVDWIFQISPYATTGNKVITFRATYEENGVFGECTFKAYAYVENGYIPNTAPSLMVESYGIYRDDAQVEAMEAGTDAVLKVTLKNNAAKDVIYKTVAVLKLSDANSLILTGGHSDSAYVRSIPAGKTAEIEYHITARASAAVGPSAATISLTYENQDVVQGTAVSNIQIPVKQQMNLQLDTPVVYGSAVQGEPVAVSLNMVNLGRSRAYNVSVVAMDGISMQDAYFGGDILAAGSLNADFQVVPNKSGSFSGTLIVQYEDADGEIYTQNVSLSLQAEEAPDEEALAAAAEAENAEQGGGFPFWLLIPLFLGVALIGLGVVLYLRRKKQKLQNENLDI